MAALMNIQACLLSSLPAGIKRLPYPWPVKGFPDKTVFFLFHTPTQQIPPEVPLPVPARIFPE